MDIQEPEVSERRKLADRVAEFVRSRDLCFPVGGKVGRLTDPKGRDFYSVTISKPAAMDGSVSIYSHKFMLLRYKTWNRRGTCASKKSQVFRKELDLQEFIDRSFVETSSTS